MGWIGIRSGLNKKQNIDIIYTSLDLGYDVWKIP